MQQPTIFNTNTIKRLASLAGINRQNKDVRNYINNIADDYLNQLLKRVLNIVVYAGRKTICVEDVQFLSNICPQYPKIIASDNTDKLTVVYILNAQGSRHCVRSRKKTFNTYIRTRINDLSMEEMRIGKNVSVIIQSLIEQYIVSVLKKAARLLRYQERETLLVRDLQCIFE